MANTNKRGPGRYLRVARVLIENPDAGVEELMNRANVGDATLNYCLDAFEEITAALKEAGLLVNKPAAPVIDRDPVEDHVIAAIAA
jgi:hypothetical protein